LSTKIGTSYYEPKTKQLTMLVHSIGINSTISHLDNISLLATKQMQISIQKKKTQPDPNVFPNNKLTIQVNKYLQSRDLSK
jgi:hypothetical protein